MLTKVSAGKASSRELISVSPTAAAGNCGSKRRPTTEAACKSAERGIIRTTVQFDASALAAALPVSVQHSLTVRVDRLAPNDRCTYRPINSAAIILNHCHTDFERCPLRVDKI
jgi:hypothetical protein